MKRALLFLIALVPALVFSQTFSGKVVGITDGDTVRVLVDRKEVKVRLDGIDAPEKAQAFGEKSRQWLASQVFQKTVTVKQKDTDRYGRVVARLIINGKDVNVESVRAGMAWWYRRYASGDRQLQEVERSAREAKRGLWADKGALAPWDWRIGVRSVPVSSPFAPPRKRTATAPQVREVSATVYVTRTGDKYHSAGCRYLRRSQIPMSRKEARSSGYDACSVCGG